MAAGTLPRPLLLSAIGAALVASAGPAMDRFRVLGVLGPFTPVGTASAGALDLAPFRSAAMDSAEATHREERIAAVALGSGLVVPVAGVTAERLRDMYDEPRTGHVHRAIDIGAPRGTPVVSATDGTLLRLHRSRSGGNMVYASDVADRFILMYAHLDRFAPGLVAGAPIRRGQLLGYVGTTGNSPKNAPHLHFAVARGKPSAKWWKGTPLNPFPLLGRAESVKASGLPAMVVEPVPKKVVAKKAVAKKAVANKSVAKRSVASSKGTAGKGSARRTGARTSRRP